MALRYLSARLGHAAVKPTRNRFVYLSEIQDRYDTITAFFVSEATRNYYHPTGIRRSRRRQPEPEDAWYARVRAMREPYEINIDNDTADRSRLSIFINYRVFGYDGDYIGTTGVGLAVSSVTTLIDSYQQRYGRTIYFIDRQGNITMTSSNGEHVSEQRLQDRPGLGAFATQVLSSPSASLSYRGPGGDNIFLNSRLVPEFDWYLVVEQEAGATDARIQKHLVAEHRPRARHHGARAVRRALHAALVPGPARADGDD